MVSSSASYVHQLAASTDYSFRKDLARIASREGAFTDEGYDIQTQKEIFLDKCKILYSLLSFLWLQATAYQLLESCKLSRPATNEAHCPLQRRRRSGL